MLRGLAGLFVVIAVAFGCGARPVTVANDPPFSEAPRTNEDRYTVVGVIVDTAKEPFRASPESATVVVVCDHLKRVTYVLHGGDKIPGDLGMRIGGISPRKVELIDRGKTVVLATGGTACPTNESASGTRPEPASTGDQFNLIATLEKSGDFPRVAWIADHTGRPNRSILPRVSQRVRDALWPDLPEELRLPVASEGLFDDYYVLRAMVSRHQIEVR